MSEIKMPDLSKYPHLQEHLAKKSHYILDQDNNVVPADLMTWADFFEHERERRIVKQEEIEGKRISTVFMGLDHCWLPPSHPEYKLQIFETMIFEGNGYHEIYCMRYSTWKEAEEGHQVAVEWVKNGCKCDE